MKKLIFAMFMGAGLCTMAQTTESTESTASKFDVGERSLELMVSPFADTPLSFNQFKFRYFNSGNSAYRLTANISQASSSTITQQQIDSLDQLELKDKSSSFMIQLSPGYEHHFAGTSRFSPYIGGSLDLGYQRTSASEEVQVGDEVIEVKAVNGNTGGFGPSQMGYFSAGVSGFAGFDFYITQKIFLGTEFGYGIAYQKNLGVKLTSNADGFEEPDPIAQGSSLKISKAANGRIRLGFLF